VLVPLQRASAVLDLRNSNRMERQKDLLSFLRKNVNIYFLEEGFMYSKITVIAILLISLSLVGCTQKEYIGLNFIQTPEQMIAHTEEDLVRMKELSDKEYQLRQEGKLEEAVKITPQIYSILSRGTVEDQVLIEEVFSEIRKLEAEKVLPTDEVKSDFRERQLFSFDLVDDKKKGIQGNNEQRYYRFIRVLNDNSIVIPVLSTDKKSVFFAKARIDDTLFSQLASLLHKATE